MQSWPCMHAEKKYLDFGFRHVWSNQPDIFAFIDRDDLRYEVWTFRSWVLLVIACQRSPWIIQSIFLFIRGDFKVWNSIIWKWGGSSLFHVQPTHIVQPELILLCYLSIHWSRGFKLWSSIIWEWAGSYLLIHLAHVVGSSLLFSSGSIPQESQGPLPPSPRTNLIHPSPSLIHPSFIQLTTCSFAHA